MRRRPRVIRNTGAIAAARARRAVEAGPRLAFQIDPLTRRVVRPLLIAVVCAAVSINMLVIARLADPGQPWLSVTWLAFFAALEGAITAAWLATPRSHGVERGVYRAAEMLLLVVLARVVSWALFGGGIPSPDEVRLFLAAPISFVLAGGFLTTAIVTLACWWLAVSMSGIFTRLDVSEYEVRYYTLSPTEQKAQADNQPIHVARVELQDQYFRLWLYVGIGMIALAALSTFEVGQFATVASLFDITRLGLQPAVLFALLAYFLGGLWLLSHARLLRLNARWLMDGAAKDAGLERAWQRSALAVLLVIAFAAAFLPIGSSLGISRIIGDLLDALFYLFGLIYTLLGYLLTALLSIIAPNQPAQPLPTPVPRPAVPPPPPSVSQAAEPNSTIAFLITSAFWTLIIALIVAALLYFLRERGYKLELGPVKRTWATLGERWRLWRKRLRRRAALAGQSLRERLRPSGPSTPAVPSGPPRLLRRALSPREQIRYYYLSTVRRAAERGAPRGENETPLEYVQTLRRHWPDVESDLDELTGAFLAARYSPQPLDKSVAGRVKEHWRRLRDRLRQRAGRSPSH